MREERDLIRLMLLRNSLTQTWLINRLEDVGVRTDKTEMSSALGGRRKGEKVNLILRKSVEILTEYEQKMGVEGHEPLSTSADYKEREKYESSKTKAMVKA